MYRRLKLNKNFNSELIKNLKINKQYLRFSQQSQQSHQCPKYPKIKNYEPSVQTFPKYCEILEKNCKEDCKKDCEIEKQIPSIPRILLEIVSFNGLFILLYGIIDLENFFGFVFKICISPIVFLCFNSIFIIEILCNIRKHEIKYKRNKKIKIKNILK
jgi:hypothetical protein